MIDVVVTTRNRVEFLKRTVESFIEKNKALSYRLFIIDDFSEDGTDEYLLGLRKKGIADIYLCKERRGVVFGLDLLWNISDFFGAFFDENSYLCYLQDDLVSKVDNWVMTAIGSYEGIGKKYNVGFFSGCDAPEHPVIETIAWDGRSVLLKRSQSAINLIAEKSFWRSIGYVPRFNPDGSSRGYPGNGRGSHIDIYLTGCYSGSRFHHTHSAPNCSFKQGKNVLVIPGCLEHLGHLPEKSTWRQD